MTDRTGRPRWLRSAVIAIIVLLIAALVSVVWEARPPRYVATPENDAATAKLVDGAFTFVLLHEAGHMMIHLFSLPRISGEEDEADRFAAAALTGGMDSDHPDAEQTKSFKVSLLSAALYFEQLHKDGVNSLKAPDWSDEHGEPEQRAFNIICMLYGRSPNEFGQLARRSGLPQQRLARCPDEAEQNQIGWQKLMADAHQRQQAGDVFSNEAPTPEGELVRRMILPSFTPQVRKVGMFFNPVPETLDLKTRTLLLRGQSLARTSGALPQVAAVMRLAPMPMQLRDVQHPELDYAYKLVGDPCIGKDGKPVANAWWSGATNSITYCYALVASIEDKSKLEVATVARRLQSQGGILSKTSPSS